MFKPEYLVFVIGALAVIILLVTLPEREIDYTNSIQKVSWTLYVLTDDNGCRYLGDGNGLTPRMDTDGKQICSLDSDITND